MIDRTGPFASVYFDSTADSEDAARRLELRCRELREKLSAAGASERMLGALGIALAAGPPDRERCGRALLSDQATVLVDDTLPEPPQQEIVRVSPLPYLLPLLEQRSRRAPHVVATVDPVGADLRGVNGYGDTLTRTVCGIGHPVHRARHDRAHRATPRRTQDVLRHNVRTMAREVSGLADRVGAVTVMLAGTPEVRSAVHAALATHYAESGTDTTGPSPTQRRIIELDGTGHGPDNGELNTQIDKIVAETTQLWRADLLARYTATRARADGLATAGLPDTAAALRESAVAQLFVDGAALDDRQILVGDGHTQVATSAHELTGPAELRRADEAVPVAAIAGDSDIVPVDGELTLPDGVGALLRPR
ncbi:hypothetical protein [Nocardia sp. NPDC050406]|uniref:baeRF2 domain-containing protein n=1 Tax=Nocardia sp. NPDC050406 TaxID=3364318 RepID=UPI0037A9DC71